MSKIPLSVFLEAMRDERENLVRRVEAIDMLLATYHESEEYPVAKPRKEKPEKHLKAGKKRHCKSCGKAGHRSDNCPNGDGTLPPDEPTTHRPEVTKEQVDELKAKGLNSIQVAARLKTTLTEVNKHW